VPKPTRWQEGFSTGALACIATLVRMNGWNAEQDARDLLRDFKPTLKGANEGDLEILREYKLIN
jgi:hypothetical protein